MRQGAQDQRRGKPLLPVQVGAEGLQIGGAARLIHQIEGGAFLGAQRDLQRGFGRQLVVVDQVAAHAVGDDVHQPLGDRDRQHLAIGDAGGDRLGLGEAVDGGAQAALGEGVRCRWRRRSSPPPRSPAPPAPR